MSSNTLLEDAQFDDFESEAIRKATTGHSPARSRSNSSETEYEYMEMPVIHMLTLRDSLKSLANFYCIPVRFK